MIGILTVYFVQFPPVVFPAAVIFSSNVVMLLVSVVFWTIAVGMTIPILPMVVRDICSNPNNSQDCSYTHWCARGIMINKASIFQQIRLKLIRQGEKEGERRRLQGLILFQ